MASPTKWSMFPSLVNVWRLLALRSDVDDLVKETWSQFSLEKVYCDGDKQSYRHLVMTLLAQLNTIYFIRRLSMPTEDLTAEWYLNFLVSWEVKVRSVEVVLQALPEGVHMLWGYPLVHDKFSAEFLMSTLRVLSLHPNAPASQWSGEGRGPFARIDHTFTRSWSLAQTQRSSFLLRTCKEMTKLLQSEASALALPPGLRYELPNLTLEMARHNDRSPTKIE